MSYAKDKGTRWETACVKYLKWALQDERIHRNALAGAHDVGDIGGIYWMGEPVVLECKATKHPMYRKHWSETIQEMSNASTAVGVILLKTPGTGMKHMSQHRAITTDDVIERLLSACEDDYTMPQTTPVGRANERLVSLPIPDFCALVNHGLPLGPDEGSES